MKKILMIAVAATLALGSCTKREAREANAPEDDHTGSFGAAGHDSLNNPSNADSMRTDGYKADSVMQTYPIPRE